MAGLFDGGSSPAPVTSPTIARPGITTGTVVTPSTKTRRDVGPVMGDVTGPVDPTVGMTLGAAPRSKRAGLLVQASRGGGYG